MQNTKDVLISVCVHGRPRLKGVPHSAGTGTQALMNWNLGSVGTSPKQVMTCSCCVYITICCCTVMKLLLLTYHYIINITSLYQCNLPQTSLNHAASPCLQVGRMFSSKWEWKHVSKRWDCDASRLINGVFYFIKTWAYPQRSEKLSLPNLVETQV